MIVGEVVEILIVMRDRTRLSQREDDAVCDACNILDKLPRLMEVEDVRTALENVTL